MLSALGFPKVGPHRRLVFTIGVDALGTGAWLPLSVIYFLRVTPLGLVQVGTSISIASAVGLPATVVVGQAVDRYGAKRVMQAGNILQLAGFAAHPFVSAFPGVTLAIALTALGRSAFWGTYGPILTSACPPGERERWFALFGATRNTGFAVGGLFSGIVVTIDRPAAYQAAVLINALTFLVAYVVMQRVKVPEVASSKADEPSRNGSWRTVLLDRGYRWLIGSGFCYSMTIMTLNLVIPVYVVETLGLPGWISGAAFVINTVMVSLGQGIVVNSTIGWIRSRIIIVAAVLSTFSFVALWGAGLMAPWAAATTILVATVIYTLGEMTADPVLESLSASAPPAELRGRYVAAYQLAWAIAYAIAPGLYSWLLSVGSLAIWGALAAIALASAAFCLPMHRSLPLAGMRVPGSENVSQAP
ncbi:MFS transporter [Streptomyces sp. NPDC028722]|uniref:MFS transporter n=1 Tax=Streptomyces sp. NPDC028722 TaxID=3155016 RepID=UPI0034081A7E